MLKEEFGEWKADPRTKEVFETLRHHRQIWEEMLLDGRLMRGNNPEFLVGEAIGVLRGIDSLLEIRWEDDNATLRSSKD
jgi:hypothetical protein